MASKNPTSPEALTSALTNRKQGEQTREEGRISTSQGIDSFPRVPPQHASTVSQLDHIAAILLRAIALVDEDLDYLKETNSESLRDDQSKSGHHK
ncbi:hypothetical protein MHU86_13362 [Fragilaria crotonensis]|nr:hypothetical protein MHU86_21899 [Fragilaria crotonensis]KAI2501139.1 hypothetical protein MHU86_13362 [Fragilaria crotonensis]